MTQLLWLRSSNLLASFSRARLFVLSGKAKVWVTCLWTKALGSCPCLAYCMWYFRIWIGLLTRYSNHKVDSTTEILNKKQFRQWIKSNECILLIKRQCQKPLELQKVLSIPRFEPIISSSVLWDEVTEYTWLALSVVEHYIVVSNSEIGHICFFGFVRFMLTKLRMMNIYWDST